MVMIMLKAIIVDDEQITRKGLMNFINWHAFGVEIVGEAEDGVEGLELVKSTKPDIALCDVRMPRMDGIRLAQYIKELLPSCKIIFLSGYSEVEYLKSAIRVNAVDYLEKPMNIAEFQKLITKTVEICHEERKNAEEKKEMLFKIERSIPYLKSKIATSLIESKEGFMDSILEDFKLLQTDFPLDSQYVCCVITSEGLDEKKDLLDMVDKINLKSSLLYLAAKHKQEYIIVFSIQGKDEVTRIIEFCQDIITRANDLLGMSLVIGMGDIAKDLYEVKRAYEEATEYLKYPYFKGINTVLTYEKMAQINAEKAVVKDIINYIKRNYNKEISINSIANEVYLSPTYLCLLFKNETGETINTYLTKVRIEKSKRLLKDRRLKLYDVANQVGYNDSNYFTKVFKKAEGCTPSEYRERIL